MERIYQHTDIHRTGIAKLGLRARSHTKWFLSTSQLFQRTKGSRNCSTLSESCINSLRNSSRGAEKKPLVMQNTSSQLRAVSQVKDTEQRGQNQTEDRWRSAPELRIRVSGRTGRPVRKSGSDLSVRAGECSFLIPPQDNCPPKI